MPATIGGSQSSPNLLHSTFIRHEIYMPTSFYVRIKLIMLDEHGFLALNIFWAICFTNRVPATALVKLVCRNNKTVCAGISSVILRDMICRLYGTSVNIRGQRKLEREEKRQPRTKRNQKRALPLGLGLGHILAVCWHYVTSKVDAEAHSCFVSRLRVAEDFHGLAMWSGPKSMGRRKRRKT